MLASITLSPQTSTPVKGACTPEIPGNAWRHFSLLLGVVVVCVLLLASNGQKSWVLLNIVQCTRHIHPALQKNNKKDILV